MIHCDCLIGSTLIVFMLRHVSKGVRSTVCVGKLSCLMHSGSCGHSSSQSSTVPPFNSPTPPTTQMQTLDQTTIGTAYSPVLGLWREHHQSPSRPYFFSWLIQSLKFFPSILWWNGMSKIHRKRACSPVFSQIAFSLEFESQSQIEGFWMGQPYIHNSFSLCASSGTTDGIKSGISKEMWWVNRIRIGERRVWWFCSSVPHSAIRLKNRTFRISWRHIYQLSIYFRVDKLCQQIRRYFSTFLTNGGI